MTCKDCVHYEVCGKGVDGAMDHDQIIFESRYPRVEFDCPNYKPKSRFVEVVRCKDCDYWRRSIGLVDNPNGNCLYNGFDTNQDDFCSFAEKALKEREKE